MNRYGLYFSLFAMTLGLAACGGGSGGDSSASGGGTAVVAKGTVTGFGSIYVNGVKFETDSSSFDVDDAPGTQDDLAIGMVVTVRGTVDGNGTTGTASSVVFDDDIEGPVSGMTTAADGLSKSFTVFNTTITVDSVSTVFEGITFASLADGDLIEVSGYMGLGGELQATYVERKSVLSYNSSEVELKGTVSGLVGNSFSLNGMTVTFDPTGVTTDLSEVNGGAVTNGAYIEVEGIINSATTLTATRIESESQSVGDDGDEISIEGVITDYVDISNFKVNGQQVNAVSAELEPAGLTLANGMQVEVEGELSGNALMADEVETRDDEIEIAATVSSVDTANRTITLRLASGLITVGTDNHTLMDDETNAVSLLTLNDLANGDYLEIEGHLNGGNVIASHIQRDSMDEEVLKGPVESFVSGSSITILGITVNTGVSTQFENSNDVSMTSSAFYAALSNGDIVEIEDDHPADGTADEVEFED